MPAHRSPASEGIEGIEAIQAIEERQRRYAAAPGAVRPILLSARHVRLLLVTDGIGSFGEADLGLLTLVESFESLERPVPPWVRFEVTTAHRGADVSADLQGFRFDPRDLSGYDEIWLLGAERRPEAFLPDGEVAALARFMDAGGGVFATGGPDGAGAALGARLPRVGSMRSWHEEPEPGPSGPEGPGGPGGPGAGVLRPVGPPVHPVLDGPHDGLRSLPAYADEGDCRGPADAAGAGGAAGAVGTEGVSAGKFPAGPGSQVVAWSPGCPVDRGAVAVYDGHPASAGRVVVDASRRRFVNADLVGENGALDPGTRFGLAGRPGGVAALADVVTYHQNLAGWLAPAAAQRDMWWRAVWWARWHHRVATALVPTGPDGRPVLADAVRAGGLARRELARVASPAAVRAWLLTHLLRAHRPEAWELLADDATLPDAVLGAAVHALGRRFPAADAETRAAGEEADLAAEVGDEVERILSLLAERYTRDAERLTRLAGRAAGRTTDGGPAGGPDGEPTR